MTLSDSDGLRAAARAILADPSGFLSGPGGLATIELVQRRLGRRIVRLARDRDHPFESTLDAATEAVVHLICSPELCKEIDGARSPFGLLWTEACRLVGRFTNRHSVDGRVMYSDTIENPKLMLPAWTTHDPAALFDNSVVDAARSTALTLVKKTPHARSHLVPPLVSWLTVNPVQRRSYVASEFDAAADRYPQLTRAEISAIANITWGSRNRENETSVLRWYLRNPHVSVKSSPSHLAALLLFQQKMSNAVPASHLATQN